MNEAEFLKAWHEDFGNAEARRHHPLKLNLDPERVLRLAELEGNGCISVGGLAVELGLYKEDRKAIGMHYRNGREAKNGDTVVQLRDRYAPDGKSFVGGVIAAVGVLYDAKPGNDFCNGNIAPIQQPVTGACMCDCLHVDDLAEFLKEKGLDKRPAGK